MVGLYGVTSYTVAQRRNEIGIRMALGASKVRTLTTIISDALKTVGIGLAIGTLLAVAVGHAVQNMLFGLKAADPASLVLAGSTIAAVAILACLLPALRATRVDPIEILRQE